MVEASILGSKGDPSMMWRMFEEISDPVRCYHLEKAITALRSFNFDWNERYIATATPGQSYDGVFVGRSGEQFMLGRGDRITIGFVADLEHIPAGVLSGLVPASITCALGWAATSRYAASKMASTVMLRRRNWSLRQSAGTYWW